MDEITVALSQTDLVTTEQYLRAAAEHAPLGHAERLRHVADLLGEASREAAALAHPRVDAQRNFVRQMARKGMLYSNPDNGEYFVRMADGTYEWQVGDVKKAIVQLIGDGELERRWDRRVGALAQITLVEEG